MRKGAKKQKKRRPLTVLNWLFSALCFLYFLIFFPGLASYLFLGIAIFSAPPLKPLIGNNKARIAASAVAFIVAVCAAPSTETTDAAAPDVVVASMEGETPSAAPTAIPLAAASPTPEPSPTATPAPTPTATPGPTPTQTPAPTNTPAPTEPPATPSLEPTPPPTAAPPTAAPADTSVDVQAGAGNSQGTMVWIPTRGGTKYHSNAGCSGMIDPIQVPLDEALAQGFEPCKRCH